MGIHEELIQMKLSFSAKYFEGNDFATNFEIKQIIENDSFFKTLFTRYPVTNIDTIEDYFNYLFASKIICFENNIPTLINDEHKELLNQIISDAKNIIIAIKKGCIIKFINTSYQTLLVHSFEPYGISEVFDATIELITKYGNGISFDVKQYVFSKCGNTVIQHFDDFEGILKANPELFDNLFPEYRLESIRGYSFKNTLNVIAHLRQNPNSSFFEKTELWIKSISNDVEELAKTLNTDNVLLHDQTIRNYVTFLRRIQHIDANRFEKVQHDLDKLLSESVLKNGHTFSMEIPTDKIKAMLASKQPIYRRILNITHTPDMVSLIWRSNLDKPPENKNSFIDMVSTNIPTNEYFTFSHQRFLDSIVTVGAVTIHTIFTNKNITNEYLNGFFDLVDCIAIETKSDVDELASDYELMTQMVGNIFSLPVDTDRLLVHSLCYGAAVFICAFSEKLLRLCYFEEMKESIYIPLNKSTIGNLLSDGNEAMTKILGKYQLKHLNYYLGQDKDGNVGMSYRNRLAHWAEINENYLTPQLVCQLFYLFTCIINSLSLYYNKRNEEATKEQNKDA